MNILACSITTTFETYCSSAEKTLYAWSTWGNTAMVIILSVYDSFNCEMTRAVSPFHPAHLWPFKMYWDPQVENSLLIYSDRCWLINLLWYAYNGLPGWHTLDAIATQLRPEETTWLQKCHRFKQREAKHMAPCETICILLDVGCKSKDTNLHCWYSANAVCTTSW